MAQRQVDQPKPARRIGVEAQITPGTEGGIDQYLMALFLGLSEDSSVERYTVIALPEAESFLRQWTGDRATIVSRPPSELSFMERAKRSLGPIRRPAGQALRRTAALFGKHIPTYMPELGDSDGYFDSLKLDALHIPYVEHYEKTRVPTVLTVHDLQHRHLPECFSDRLMTWRERWYPAAMQHATIIATGAAWIRDDIVRQYGVSADKIRVVHAASPIAAYRLPDAAEREAIRRKLGAPETFALYPALTYQHKNHVRLLEAVARLRDRYHVVVPVVCPGKKKLHWRAIRERRDALGLHDQVIFPGFVEPHELRALYAMARCVVFPSLFEGAGLPALEAIAEGVALAAADLPSLREYVGDAALYFDPHSVDSIASAMHTLWDRPNLRRALADAGRDRSVRFSPARMAADYRAVYAELASRPGPPPRPRRPPLFQNA